MQTATVQHFWISSTSLAVYFQDYARNVHFFVSFFFFLFLCVQYPINFLRVFFETFCALKFWSWSSIWSLSNTGRLFSQASIRTMQQSLFLGTTVQVTNHLYCWSLQGSTVKVSGEGHEVISQNHTLWQLWEWWCGKSSVGGQWLPRLMQQRIQNCSNYIYIHTTALNM